MTTKCDKIFMCGWPNCYACIKKIFLCAHNFLAVPHKKNKMHTWNILAYFFVHLIFAVPTSDMQTGLIDTPMQFPLPHAHRPSLCMRSWWKGSWGRRRRTRGGRRRSCRSGRKHNAWRSRRRGEEGGGERKV